MNQRFKLPILRKLTLLLAALACFLNFTLPANSDSIEGNLPVPVSDEDYRPISLAKAKLGRLLFYDPILSGNKNISCATCHHHKHATTDNLSLPIGEGGEGLGLNRTVGTGKNLIEFRVPRNSQSLFNLGAKEFTTLFHDGRVELNPAKEFGIDTPADEDLPEGLANILAAQAMFPVLSETEMLGNGDENDLASAFRYEIEDVWPLIAKRVAQIREYEDLFKSAFHDIEAANEISMVHIANAISDFIAFEWRASNSPFDRHLRGEQEAMTEVEQYGMEIFYGKGVCFTCHAGKFQTDHDFHAIAMPQIGLSRTRRFDPVVRDMGRINQSDKLSDAYKFRTPSLRNIAHTPPYGHSGAYSTLDAVIRHHLNPVESFMNYNRSQAVLPFHPTLSESDFVVMENEREINHLLAANELPSNELNDREIEALLAFLHTLTDEESLKGRLGIPENVPSGLPIDR